MTTYALHDGIATVHSRSVHVTGGPGSGGAEIGLYECGLLAMAPTTVSPPVVPSSPAETRSPTSVTPVVAQDGDVDGDGIVDAASLVGGRPVDSLGDGYLIEPTLVVRSSRYGRLTLPLQEYGVRLTGPSDHGNVIEDRWSCISATGVRDQPGGGWSPTARAPTTHRRPGPSTHIATR